MSFYNCRANVGQQKKDQLIFQQINPFKSRDGETRTHGLWSPRPAR